MVGSRRQVFLLVAGAILWLSASRPALAHCDTMDGPVVAAARAAIERGDTTPWEVVKRELLADEDPN